MKKDILSLDKRIAKNEINITNFCDKFDSMASVWYWLLALFFTFVTGIFFVSMYITSSFVKSISAQIMIVLLVFEFGGILYLAFFK